jgi:hypothetical protein
MLYWQQPIPEMDTNGIAKAFVVPAAIIKTWR